MIVRNKFFDSYIRGCAKSFILNQTMMPREDSSYHLAQFKEISRLVIGQSASKYSCIHVYLVNTLFACDITAMAQKKKC